MADENERDEQAADGAEGGEQNLPDFEHSLAEVQQIIERMESGEVSLERSLEHYARGTKLIQHCNRILSRAEEQFRKLSPPAGGAGGAEEPSEES